MVEAKQGKRWGWWLQGKILARLESSDLKPWVGIYLGNTHSSAALLVNNEIEILKNMHEDTQTPTVVHLSGPNGREIKVGRQAQQKSKKDKNLISDFKRLIGEGYSSNVAAHWRELHSAIEMNQTFHDDKISLTVQVEPDLES